MNIILDPCPSAIVVDGHFFNIDTDFKTGLRFFRLLVDETLSDDERANVAILMYCGKRRPPQNKTAAMREIIKFLQLNREAEGSNGPRVFDYEQDAGFIYAAFRQAYGIDLTKAALNWWEFVTLVEGLPDDTKLADVIRIRATKVPSAKDGATPEARQQLLRLKALYALDKKGGEGQKKKAQSFFDSLRGR